MWENSLGEGGVCKKNNLLPETKFVRVNLGLFLCPVWFKTHDFKLRFHPHPNSGLSVLIGCCSSPSSHLFYTFVWGKWGGGALQFKRGSPKLELPLCFLSHLLAHSACCTFVTLQHSSVRKDTLRTEQGEKALLMITGILETLYFGIFRPSDCFCWPATST